jgi:prevent-host-death family protein
MLICVALVDLLRDLKTVTHAAAREPVAITQHRKPRFVLMAIEDFERLQAGVVGPRKAYRLDEHRANWPTVWRPASIVS